jgi:hypothetical protein
MQSSLKPKKQKEGNGQTSKSKSQHSNSRSARVGIQESASRFSLRNTLGFWELTFDGQSAVLKQDQGLFYAAWLLTAMLAEPVLALDLATLVHDRAGEHPDFRRDMPWLSRARDEAEIGKVLRRKQHALEAILDSGDEPDPVKAEALRELDNIQELQEIYFGNIADTAETTGEMVAGYLRGLHASLATALDGHGNPHSVLRAFAHHLLICLLMPSNLASVQDRAARFVYRPPAEVMWEDWDGRTTG